MSQGAQARVSLGTVTKFQLLAACQLIAIRRVRWPQSGLFFYLSLLDLAEEGGPRLYDQGNGYKC